MTSDPLWQRVPAPLRFEGTALGLGLRIDTNAPHVLDLAVEAFGRFARSDHEGDRPTDIAIEALVGPGDVDAAPPSSDPGSVVDAPPSRPAAPRLFHRERGPLYTAGDDHGSVVVADLAGGRAAAFIAPATPPEIVRTVLLESPVWRIAAWRGLVALHAAAVVVDGRTVILRGLGGAGKSSLTYAAARAGHTVLAEEVVWFDPTGPEPVLRGAPWTLHLEPEAAALFPELRDRETVRRSAGSPKIAIDIERDIGGTCVEVAPLGPIVFVDRSPISTLTESSRLPVAPALERFESSLLAAELTQERGRIDAARDALFAYGAARAALVAYGAWDLRVGAIMHGVVVAEDIARGC